MMENYFARLLTKLRRGHQYKALIYSAMLGWWGFLFGSNCDSCQADKKGRSYGAKSRSASADFTRATA